MALLYILQVSIMPIAQYDSWILTPASAFNLLQDAALVKVHEETPASYK